MTEIEMTSVEDHFDLGSDYNHMEIEIEDVKKFIKELINKLPERFSAVITMFYLNEMTIEEISQVTQLSVSNVKVMLYRSRNALRDLILKSNLAEELI